MTCNQLMVLLDIYRGSFPQSVCGTLREDLEFLRYERLVVPQVVEGEDPALTKHGRAAVGAVLLLFTPRTHR